MNHTGIVSEWLIVSQIVGYTAGTVIMILLFVLVRRAARFDDPSPYGLLLWSVLAWNAGNLVAASSLLAGVPGTSAFVGLPMFFAYIGAAWSPTGALIMWRGTALRRAAIGVWLLRASIVSGAILTVMCVSNWGRHPAMKPSWDPLAYHVTFFFVAGALLFYREHVTVMATRVAIGMTGLGALGVGLSVALQKPLPADPQALDFNVLLALLRQAATHLMTLGALFFLARFRFADVFVRESLRMIAALLLGLLCVFTLALLAILLVSTGAAHPRPVALVGGALFVAALIFSFVLIDRLIVAAVDRGLFQQPDYGAALRRLRDALAFEHDDRTLHALTARHVRDTLDLRDARIVASPSLTPAVREDLTQREVADVSLHFDADGLAGAAGTGVPVRTGGVVTAALMVAPRPDHPTFLATEVEFLRAAATTLGHRLDVVQRERQEIERHTHEAHLRQQLSEATLRALQAQVNPHFLFNTLNTIAHLIQADPASAEGMTLRLAEVFSHVLTRSLRPFSSVREEMDFLRTYLTIEEARFGDRLRVAFAVDPAAAQAAIPSLILQPAVENALKHGLAPKIGPGHLTISASIDGASLCMSVEDDGVGPRGRAKGMNGQPGGNGVGLRNIADRLRTLYADRASLHFDPRPRGGSVLTLRLPFHQHDQKPVD